MNHSLRIPLVVPCSQCPCYIDPSADGVVQNSKRLGEWLWHIDYTCAACAERVPHVIVEGGINHNDNKESP